MRRAFPFFFFAIGCLLLTLGLASFGAGFVQRGNETIDVFAWKPPLEYVDNRALAPATVILPLTDMSGSDALNAALDAAHLENAFAIVAYDITLQDVTRVGALLQLGTQFTTARNPRRAAVCYQSAAFLATTSPSLSDSARMDVYLQAASGLRGIQAQDAARWVTDQAYLVAQHSPTLQRLSRARRLEQIADAYGGLGVSTLAAQARTQANDLAIAANETTTVTVHTTFVEMAGALPGSPEVDALRQTRIAAAQQLVDDLQNETPKNANAWPPDSVTQLADALLAEDEARDAFYQKQVAVAKEPAVKMALLRDKIKWLTLKYRVARGAFGINLVDEWSKNAGAIAGALGETWTDWVQLQESQAGALPKPQDAVLTTEDVVMQEWIAARWGWYVGVPEKELTDALKNVEQSLMDAALPGLRLDTITRDGKTTLILLPDELYGKNEKALPK